MSPRSAGRIRPLDHDEMTLVDVEVVRFLKQAEDTGMVLRHIED